MRHVQSLLAEARERELAADEQRRVDMHLADCGECRALASELARNDASLARPWPASVLLPLRAAPGHAARGRTFVAASAIVTAVVVGLIAGCTLRATPSVGPAGSASDSASALSVGRPAVVFVEHVSGGAVPGGGTVINDAVAAIDLVFPDDRPVLRHVLEGFSHVDLMSWSGTRMAYWRNSQPLRSPPYELVVWDAAAGTTSVANRVAKIPTKPIWSTDGRSIVFSISDSSPFTAQADPPPVTAEVIIVALSSGDAHTVLRFDRQYPLVPFAVIDGLVAGFAHNVYETADIASGRIVSRMTADSFTAAIWDGGGAVAGVVGLAESPSRSMRAWQVSDYGVELGRVAASGITTPLFRPGHPAIAYVLGPTIREFDYMTGADRELFASTTSLPLIAFDHDGRYLLASAGLAGYRLLELTADGAVDRGLITSRPTTDQPIALR